VCAAGHAGRAAHAGVRHAAHEDQVNVTCWVFDRRVRPRSGGVSCSGAGRRVARLPVWLYSHMCLSASGCLLGPPLVSPVFVCVLLPGLASLACATCVLASWRHTRARLCCAGVVFLCARCVASWCAAACRRARAPAAATACVRARAGTPAVFVVRVVAHALTGRAWLTASHCKRV
jgi:hypothetical protein